MVPGARLDKTFNLLQTAIGVIRIGGEFAGGPLYRYLGCQEASDLHANYREGTVADFLEKTIKKRKNKYQKMYAKHV